MILVYRQLISVELAFLGLIQKTGFVSRLRVVQDPDNSPEILLMYLILEKGFQFCINGRSATFDPMDPVCPSTESNLVNL